MASASVTLANGTRVTVEGTPEELKRVIDLISDPNTRAPSTYRSRPASATKQRKGRRAGPTDRVRALRQSSYFKEKRTLSAILKKLEEQGHIYEPDDLSPVLVRLTRAGELRRVRDKSGWAYVNP